MAEKLTLQRIFDLAWQAFIVEEQPPGVVRCGDRFTCGYGAGGARPCAVGLGLHAVGADEDTLSLEAGFDTLVEGYPELFADDIHEVFGDGLDEIQSRLHDDLVDKQTGQWKASVVERAAEYRTVARDYNLTIPGES